MASLTDLGVTLALGRIGRGQQLGNVAAARWLATALPLGYRFGRGLLLLAGAALGCRLCAPCLLARLRRRPRLPGRRRRGRNLCRRQRLGIVG
jgi:hypothetical protein